MRTKKMETSVYYPVLVLTHIISEESCPNSKYTSYYQEREENHFSLVKFLEPKIESIQEGEAGDLHLYTDIRLDTAMGHFELLLPHLIVTKGMYPLWSLSKEGRTRYIISGLRKIISPYCKKNGNTYIVRYPGQEGSCIDIESYWTEHPSDPDILECVRLTATIQKDKIKSIGSIVSRVDHILASSPYLIALRTMLSEEKTMIRFAGIHLSDYKTKVSIPVNNSGLYVVDLFLTREDELELVPIKFESELELPEVLELISKEHVN